LYYSGVPQADLTFLYGQYVPQCDHVIDKHYDDYQTLQYMAGGAVELGVGETQYLLKGKWFWSAFAGPRISFHVAVGHSTWTHRFIAFRGPLVGRWTAERLFPIVPQRPPGGRDFAGRFDQLLRNAGRADRWGRLHAINLVEGILIELAEARSQVPAGEPWLDRTLEVLTAAADGGEVDYAGLSEELGMDQTTLRRRFRAAMSMSPHAYLLQCRATSARRLLGETDLPIKSIAQQLGYRDVYFFSRQFRQMTGVPPAVYRRSRHG
jgi:AraC-like DNA-binding protein